MTRSLEVGGRRDAFRYSWVLRYHRTSYKEGIPSSYNSLWQWNLDFGIMFHTATYPKSANCSLYTYTSWTGVITYKSKNQTVNSVEIHRTINTKQPTNSFCWRWSCLGIWNISIEGSPWIFSSLLKAYEQAELEGLVDQHGWAGWAIPIPLFHESRKAAKNIVNVTLSRQGEILTAEWLDDGSRIIFPVTPASVTRTAKPEPHPLVDKPKTYLNFPAYQVHFTNVWKHGCCPQVVLFIDSDIITKVYSWWGTLREPCQ